ncbi:MAG: outer membrane beta-barrel domain-containing protein [Myxococcota bacterium]|nr:outer membrane beta-barrel domain-containing protein [Myxococcota bacterium]
MRTFLSLKTWLVLATLAVLPHGSAFATDTPAGVALEEVRNGKTPYNAVQNRFFLKEGRIEATPILGYVPNNPMVKRYVGGLLGAYHFSETFAAEGAFLYSPDLGQNDLKGLTHTLVAIPGAAQSESEFQQPLDKMIMGATFAARWAPFYGKINLIGESVLNFDAYGVAGLGMLSLQSYYAQYDEEAAAAGDPTPTVLDPIEKKAVLTPNLGIGFNFFLNQTLALKIDARNYFYIGAKPQYDPNEPINEKRLYTNFVASVGLSFFIPEMKKRMYNF